MNPLTLVTKLWAKLEGWKTIIAYILTFATANPALLEAISRVLTNPDPATTEGAAAYGNLVVQLLLLLGVSGILVRNLQYGVKRKYQP